MWGNQSFYAIEESQTLFDPTLLTADLWADRALSQKQTPLFQMIYSEEASIFDRILQNRNLCLIKWKNTNNSRNKYVMEMSNFFSSIGMKFTSDIGSNQQLIYK